MLNVLRNNQDYLTILSRDIALEILTAVTQEQQATPTDRFVCDWPGFLR